MALPTDNPQSSEYMVGPGMGDDSLWVPITSGDYHRVVGCRAPLLETLLIEERFQMIVGNYEDFENEILRLALQHSLYMESAISDLAAHRRTLARRALNLLAACRLYCDQMPSSLARLFGRSSPLSGDFQDRITSYRKFSLSFRLMEALRNILQHQAMPLRVISAPCTLTDLKEGRGLATTITLQVDKSILQSDRRSRDILESDLEELPDHFDLKPHVKLYVSRMADLNELVRSKLSPDVQRWEAAVESVRNAYCSAHGLNVAEAPSNLFVRSVSATALPKQASPQYVPTSVITERRQLISRTKHFANLHVRYVTNLPAEWISPSQRQDIGRV